jgi:3-oxoacyl-[acyl-carrier protein] reductase
MSQLFEPGTVALVTGASGGIGRGIAVELAKNGASVIINYYKNKTGAEETLRLVHEVNGKGAIICADVADQNQVNKMYATVKKHFKRLDILVNNAGIIKDCYLLMMSSQTFEEVIHTNLMGSFYNTQAALRLMCERKSGNIVNIASTSGKVGQAGQANYSASKGAVVSFTKSVAKEYADKGVRCNAVAPGFITTSMTNANKDLFMEKYGDLIPLARFGEVAEVAKTVLFLTSPMSSYITGEMITVDGGMTI